MIKITIVLASLALLLVGCTDYTKVGTPMVKDNKIDYGLGSAKGEKEVVKTTTGSNATKIETKPEVTTEVNKPTVSNNNTTQTTDNTSVTNNVENNSNSQINQKIEELKIQPTFNFKTTQEINLKLTVKDSSGVAMSNIKFDIYNGDPEQEGKIINSLVTNEQGLIETKITIPSYVNQIVVITDYLGLNQKASIPINSTNIDYVW